MQAKDHGYKEYECISDSSTDHNNQRTIQKHKFVLCIWISAVTKALKKYLNNWHDHIRELCGNSANIKNFA